MITASSVYSQGGYVPCSSSSNTCRYYNDENFVGYAVYNQPGVIKTNFPKNFPSTYIPILVYQDSSGSLNIPDYSINYDILYNYNNRLVIRIYNDIYQAGYSKLAPSGSIWIYDPVIWDAWIPDYTQIPVWLELFNSNMKDSDKLSTIDGYVQNLYDKWKLNRTSFWHDAIPLAAAFAAIVISAGTLTQSAAAATDVGTIATGSSIPTYIAAPTLESGIPEYIAASTPAAALPVDAALGTDASILGLTGGTAESSIYGTVENLISQGKDVVSQYKPVISDIGKLETAYKGVSTVAKKPVPKAASVQPSGAPASQVGGLIPIGIILGLLLFAA